MKFNWGHGIAVFFAGFATFMIIMVIKFSKQNSDLVSDDYYEKEIAYQGNIDAANNCGKYNEKATVTVNGDGDVLACIKTDRTVSDKIDTQLNFYKPDNKNADFTINKVLSADPSVISMQGKPKGRWHVYVSWNNVGHKATATFDIKL